MKLPKYYTGSVHSVTSMDRAIYLAFKNLISHESNESKEDSVIAVDVMSRGKGYQIEFGNHKIFRVGVLICDGQLRGEYKRRLIRKNERVSAKETNAGFDYLLFLYKGSRLETIIHRVKEVIRTFVNRLRRIAINERRRAKRRCPVFQRPMFYQPALAA